MKKKLIIVLPVLLIVLGGVYKFVLSKPEVEAKPHIEGTVYVLGKEFLVNLADGRYAKMTVALLLDPHDTSAAPAEGGHGGGAKPPEGFGEMPQEAVVRDIVTDELTDAKDADLIRKAGRDKLKKSILKKIHKSTDVHADEVLFTDVTVQ
jgi:flagellar basal body-associated protein FliL